MPPFLEPRIPLDIGSEAIGGAEPGSGQTTFATELQQQTNWCWAAVSVSIARFFSSSYTQAQCQLVNAALKRSDCCGEQGANGGTCNRAWALHKALQINGNLVRMDEHALSFGDVQAQVGDGKPIGCRIGWFQGGGHFVVITGWAVGETGTAYLDIADPLDGPEKPTPIVFDEFPASYRMVGGNWTHTYLTDIAGAGGAVAFSSAVDPNTLGA